MFVVILKFSENRSNAPALMADHNAWIARGFADGVFLLTGGVLPNAGGAILAHNATMEEIRSRVQEDPFVAEGVVEAETSEIKANRTDERLAFLTP